MENKTLFEAFEDTLPAPAEELMLPGFEPEGEIAVPQNPPKQHEPLPNGKNRFAQKGKKRFSFKNNSLFAQAANAEEEAATGQVKTARYNKTKAKNPLLLAGAVAAVVAVIVLALALGGVFSGQGGSVGQQAVITSSQPTLIVITVSGDDIFYNGAARELKELRQILREFDPASITVSIVDDQASPRVLDSIHQLLASLSIAEGLG
ncbi:MAG: hypothetical protein LBM65_03440 [Oscillospiraceae bacterium]|jgi:hypothetical protein|nr:hypothetical protein [Oscillospiraceae bacterium]